jgi:hypothetical protein
MEGAGIVDREELGIAPGNKDSWLREIHYNGSVVAFLRADKNFARRREEYRIELRAVDPDKGVRGRK